jgi:Fe-S cluster assembly protein SufD
MKVAAARDTLKETEPYLKKFNRFEKETKQPSWVFPLRKAGMAQFAEQGFPTLNDEDWRFTNVAPIAGLPFEPAFEASAETLSRETVEAATFGKLDAIRLVFVDGHYTPALSAPASSQTPLPAGMVVTHLSAALISHPALVEKHLARLNREEKDAFNSLNTAFFQDGGFIYLPAGQVLETPIHLLFLSTGKDGAATHPRNIVVLEKGAQATILESFGGLRESAYFTNAVSEIVLGESAILEIVKFQDESSSAYHISSFNAHLGKRAHLVAHSIALGAKLSRNNIRTTLAGEGVECVLNGLYLTRGDQLADHHMIVEHAQPHCNSHEYFNGILDGRSKGVFHGRILVRQLAQKTDAKQTNKNLLLSENATVDTKPQLEIYADDVKCTHGATIGQLNEEAIFYLRSRGIGSETARRMLIHSFAGEITERVRHRSARAELDQLVWDRLEANHLAENA